MSRKVIFVDMVTVRQQLGIAPQDINVRLKDIVQNSPDFLVSVKNLNTLAKQISSIPIIPQMDLK